MCIDLKYISKIIHSDLVLVTQFGNTFVSLGFIVILWVNWVDVVFVILMSKYGFVYWKNFFMLIFTLQPLFSIFPIDL